MLMLKKDPGNAQSWRRGVQIFLLALNIWIGLQFVFFVHYSESKGRAIQVSQPLAVEG
jgi:heme/copper-type cytochrome/quinol oxidase subunit 4